MLNRDERKVRIFKNGRSRAVRIPREFDFEGNEVLLRKEKDGRISLEPLPQKRSPKELVAWLKSQQPLDEDFSKIEDFPPDPVDLDFPE
jgi:antitoxin VapB